ncbi:MAG: 2-oxoacid:ferredoxin oxidoreductase subunit beta [Candidatus Scalindua sp. AMX11]|nr:MAG: 2-oxoacid:ferredoxin oxidoreductase subunit beta [Candidatus Scalindua sp.]NOG84635.1 2-oxoacid:ferredoxin oxidoreductase subunit beta [Planctomycetota bacterium]RZV92408.1 MAG: 2-oxoacid:ferredoxin oxidoreductase subunit beta [Candidatus Scalindua sp. SCAELEC01]TDE66066.1 MAG: 2-oxoacid:ferredoxin oxidoreductase subunit beta [Candidatus Scalindua sp. AMX11]
MMSFLSKRSVLEGLNSAKASKTKEWRDNLPTWCPGCGHFTGLHGLYEAVEKLKIPQKDFVVVSGIGCSGRFPFFIKGFGLHGLHGRALPLATGIKIANPALTVVVVGGDGDGVGIGGGHFPHAARNNFNLTYILLDNSIYGLTKGQISPTSPMGMKSGTSPYGNIARPINPTTLALAYEATFVARVFSRERDMVSDIITKAIQHNGFSFIHVLSPCVVFNKLITYNSWHEVVADLPADHDTQNRSKAMGLAASIDPIYLGIFHQENTPSFDDLSQQIKKGLITPA